MVGGAILAPFSTGEGANLVAIGRWIGVWVPRVLQGLEGLLCEVPGRMGAWCGGCGFLSKAAVLEEAGGSTPTTLGFFFSRLMGNICEWEVQDQARPGTNTLEIHTMTKWELSQECKVGLTTENELHTILIAPGGEPRALR